MGKESIMQIREDEIYTAADVQKILKISQSTAMRLLKKGYIRAAKIGKQYRITGREIIRLLSPDFAGASDLSNKSFLVHQETSKTSGDAQ